MTVVMVVVVVLLGALLGCQPYLSRRATPLGVAVPSDRTADPAVTGAVHRFQIGVGALTLLTALIAVVVSQAVRPEDAAILPLVLLVLAGVWYVHCRGPILRAKRAGDWFAGRPAIVRASVTPQEPQRLGHAAVSVLAVATAVPLVALAYLGGIWGRIPARVPIHFDGTFQADGWIAKGPGLVALVVGVPLGLVGLMAGLSVLTLKAPSRTRGADVAAATAAARALRATMVTWLAIIALSLSVGLSLSFVVSVNDAGSQTQRLTTYAGLALALLGVVGMLVGIVRARRASTALDDDAIDDDRYWKGGLLYVNPDDPALWVDKRTGIGMTINLGHPVGRVIGIGLIVLVVATVVLLVGVAVQPH